MPTTDLHHGDAENELGPEASCTVDYQDYSEVVARHDERKLEDSCLT